MFVFFKNTFKVNVNTFKVNVFEKKIKDPAPVVHSQLSQTSTCIMGIRKFSNHFGDYCTNKIYITLTWTKSQSISLSFRKT